MPFICKNCALGTSQLINSSLVVYGCNPCYRRNIECYSLQKAAGQLVPSLADLLFVTMILVVFLLASVLDRLHYNLNFCLMVHEEDRIARVNSTPAITEFYKEERPASG